MTIPTVVTSPQIKFGPVDPTRDAHLPQRAHHDDAGFDLVTTERVVIPSGRFADLPTNIWVALPRGWWGLVTGRSSALRKHGLLVHSGIIDAGYRGELYAGAFNLSDRTVYVEPGQRLAQFIPVPLPPPQVEFIADGPPPPGSRGAAGFGSTGA